MTGDDVDHSQTERPPADRVADQEIDRAVQRLRIIGWFGAVLLAIAGIWVTIGPLDDDRPCSRMERRLDGIWDAKAKVRVRNGIEATRAPYAPDAADDVERILDDYSAAWVKMRAAACEATNLGGDQSPALLDLRLHCLDRRLVELGALAELLAAADRPLVGHAARAVRALSDIEDCADTATLSRTMPRPSEPTARAHVETLEADVDRIVALAKAGKHAVALEQAQSLVEPASATDYRPLQAEVLFLLGASQVSTGNPEAGAETIRQAALAAEAGRHDDLAARAWARLVLVSGVELSQPEQAHNWAERGATVAERMASERHSATLACSLGRVLIDEGRYEEAYEQLTFALIEREARLGPDHFGVIAALDGMAAARQKQGKGAEATAIRERVLAVSEQALGPVHPDVARAHDNLGLVLRGRRKLTAALGHFRKALEIYETALGPNTRNAGITLLHLSEVLVELGRPDAAVPQLERALQINEAALPENHPSIAATVFALGLAHEKAGRNAIALEKMRQALAGREAAFGREHEEVGVTRCALGRVQLALGNRGDALTELERCLAILDTALGPASLQRAEALVPLAELRLATGAPALALEPLQKALDAWGDAVNPVVRARADFALAKLLWETGQNPERAIDLAEDARFALSDAGEGLNEEITRIGEWLAGRGADELP